MQPLDGEVIALLCSQRRVQSGVWSGTRKVRGR